MQISKPVLSTFLLTTIFSTSASHAASSVGFSEAVNPISVQEMAMVLQNQPADDAESQTDLKKEVQVSKTKVLNNESKTQKVEVKGNREYDARRFDTASKIVISQEEIAKFGDTEITDVLKRLPSVSIVGGAIRMRGLGSGYTQILLNGEPSPPGFTIESLSPDLIERIEIVRSASAEFSTQAIAGTINVILKKTVQIAQRLIKLSYYQRGTIPSGSYDTFQLSNKWDNFSYSVPVNVVGGRSENKDSRNESRNLDATGNLYQIRSTTTSNQNHYASISSAPRLNWTIDSDNAVTLNGFFSAGKNTGGNRTETRSELGSIYPFVYEDYLSESSNRNFNFNSVWTHKLGDSASLEMRVGANFWHGISTGETLGSDQSETVLFDRHVNSTSTNRGWTSGGKYTAPYFEDHAVSMGWELASRQQKNDNATRGTTAMQEQVTPILLDEDVRFVIARSAAYAQDEWTLNKNLSLYLGARWEAITADGDGNNIADVHNRSAVWSPILQSLYKIPDHPNQQFRFAFARTYKAVNAWDLIHRHYYSTNNSATSPDSLANPNLQPELSTGFDVTYEHFLEGGGVFSANVFLRKISGITLTKLFQQDGLWVNMPVNAGHAHTTGIELEAKFPLRHWMEDAPAIDLRFNAGFNNSQIDTVPGPNNRLDSQVPARINMGVDYKASSIPLSLGAGFAFQNAGLVRLSPYQTNYANVNRSLDAYALWKFDQSSNLRFAMSNLIHLAGYAENRYVDANGTILRNNWNPSKLAMRINYELRF